MEATSLDQIAYSLQASGGEWAALRVRAPLPYKAAAWR